MADVRLASDAARRVAESLLRGSGGRAVSLRVPAPVSEPTINEELGLASPEFQDIELSPVVFRKARAQGRSAGTFWELIISAISVGQVLGTVGDSDASALFAGAFGVLIDGTLMEIESMSASDMDGSPYVYRVVLRAPAAKEL